MSLAISELNTVTVANPVTDTNSRDVFQIHKGPLISTWTQITTNAYSDSQIQFSAPPPNPQTVIDRLIYVGVPIKLSFSGDTGNVNTPLLNYAVRDAFRAFPLHSILQTLTVTINTGGITMNINEVLPDLLWYGGNPPNDQNQQFSLSPTMMDQSQNYSELVSTMRNPLGGYGDSGLPYEMKRGEFLPKIITNTSTAAEVQAFLVEPLLISPFLFGKMQEMGLTGIQNLVFNFTFNAGKLNRAWSHAADPTAGTFNAPTATFLEVDQIAQKPTMFFRYCTLPIVDSNPSLEKVYSYPYNQIQSYATETSTLYAPGAAGEIISNNIQLPVIPERLFLYLRIHDTDRTYLTTDTFAQITNVSINWNNQSGILASATQYDLYNISRKNGCRMSFPQWMGECGNALTALNKISGPGSLLCIDFADDIGLNDLEAPGQLGTYQFQVTIKFKNVNPTLTQTYRLMAVFITSGVLQIFKNEATTSVGILSKEEVLKAKTFPQVQFKNVHDFYGGNFWNGLKSFVSRAAKGVQKALPYVEKALPYVQQGVQLASKLGAGKRKHRHHHRRHHHHGGDFVGGKLISRNELAKRAKH